MMPVGRAKQFEEYESQFFADSGDFHAETTDIHVLTDYFTPCVCTQGNQALARTSIKQYCTYGLGMAH